MKAVVAFLKKILLVIELIIAVAVINFEKTFFIGVIFLDQFTKMKVSSTMIVGESIPVISNFFHLTYAQNPGAAFGVLPNYRVFFLFVGVLGLATFAYLYKIAENDNKILKFGILSIMSGTVGNLIDRFTLGYVIDFMDFKIWSAIFNVADMAIVLGMGIIIYDIMTTKETPEKIKEAQH